MNKARSGDEDDSTGRSGQRKRDAVATRRALLLAAKACFARDGYEGTSTREIASVAGVNQTLVYRYFGSKQDLFFAAAAVGPPVSELLDGGLQIRDLPRRLTESLLGDGPAEPDDPASDHPMIAFLTSASHGPVREQMREAFSREFTGRLAIELDGPDAALRAELIAALLLGAGVLRTLIRSPELSKAPLQDIGQLIDRACQRLIDED